MNITTIIRAWKDREYRLGLPQEELALLPEHPAGLLELDDADLAQVLVARKGRKSAAAHAAVPARAAAHRSFILFTGSVN
jgi:mersacidin/lichenicidin family type 2 lantibiotic